MSAWTHFLCLSCYAKVEPGRHPIIMDDEPEPLGCCACGKLGAHVAYRADPRNFVHCDHQ